MGSYVIKSFSMLLGVFFIFVGTAKLSPILGKDLHKDLRKEFVRYAKVLPFNEDLFKLSGKWYRIVYGCIEVACGFSLVFMHHSIRAIHTANLVLIFMMILVIYSHYMVENELVKILPALTFFLLLVACFIVNLFWLSPEKSGPITSNNVKQQGSAVNAWKKK